MGVKYIPKAEWGTGILDRLRPPATAPTAPAPTGGFDLDSLFSQFGVDGLNGAGSSSSQGSSWSASPVLPPVLELLQEMRARRDSLAQRQSLIAEILGSNVPRGQKNYLGFEPGGVADILMGMISGEGAGAGQRILPADQRAVRRQSLPIPGAEPEVGQEAGGAMDLARQILEAIRVISTGGSQQSSGSSQTSGSSSADSGLGAGINAALAGIGG